ncbi:hypothetical protein I314_06627 [Cryptococcus bacillisporus CA1873]|uniref:Uncharacterized protein n=2 Tax=Cryptococcus gattii TaxID=552467 RepID=A0A0D0VDF3_CRYGA|nr:hypothetical protein I312_06290 [Cryptococcus bacillisporus CA1280]KIR57595.1 hypothetical protein I314_06627 [Cryptococcus bacillisporus CA1873]|eukprot:KIR57595.1 hypothetical protein I314_06627 [Cryptococcus gattii CA1873]
MSTTPSPPPACPPTTATAMHTPGLNCASPQRPRSPRHPPPPNPGRYRYTARPNRSTRSRLSPPRPIPCYPPPPTRSSGCTTCVHRPARRKNPTRQVPSHTGPHAPSCRSVPTRLRPSLRRTNQTKGIVRCGCGTRGTQAKKLSGGK